MSTSEVFSTVVASRDDYCSEDTLESRREYEILMTKEDGKQLLEKEIVEPALDKLGLKKSESLPVKVRLIKMSDMQFTDREMTDTFTVGRHSMNDIIVDDPYSQVSRIHFVVFFANNKIVILDTWSLHGTSTIKNSTQEEVSSTIGNRKMISFDVGVRFMIRIEGFTLIFNQDLQSSTAKDCIICCSNPRSMRFECGHSTTCEECARIIMNGTMTCPICKQHVSTIRASEAFHTYTTNLD